jgi:hypothetical protein
MKFECYVPYNQLELNIIEANGLEIDEFYYNLEELIEYCGHVEYTKMFIEIDSIDGIGDVSFPIDELKEN